MVVAAYPGGKFRSGRLLRCHPRDERLARIAARIRNPIVSRGRHRRGADSRGWLAHPARRGARCPAAALAGCLDRSARGALVGAIATGAATLGSTLQGWLGARQVRRWVHPAIDSGRDVLRFSIITPLVCTVSATVCVPVLTALGLIAKAEQLGTWVSWWAGDSIGVLLAAPLVWIVCGEPRAVATPATGSSATVSWWW